MILLSQQTASGHGQQPYTPSFLPLTQQVDTVPLHWLLSGQVMLLPLNAVWSVIASFVIRVSEGFLMLLTGKWRVEVAPSTARRTTMVATEVMAGLFCQIRNVTLNSAVQLVTPAIPHIGATWQQTLQSAPSGHLSWSDPPWLAGV